MKPSVILDDSFRIKQIRKAISKINRLMDQFENYETYLNKDLMQDTLIKNIELVGEYVYRMTNEVKNSFLEIPWGKIEKCVIYWSINTMTFI